MSGFYPAPKPDPKVKHLKSLKRSNPVRKAKEFARTYHSSERVEFVKSLPCLVADCRSRLSSTSERDNAHLVPDGLSRKGHYTKIVPLCRAHHRILDEHPEGRAGFEGEFYVELEAMAADTERLWCEYRGIR